MKRKRILAAILTLATVLALSACGASSQSSAINSFAGSDGGMYWNTMDNVAASGASSNSSNDFNVSYESGSRTESMATPPVNDTQVHSSEMKIIKTGDMSIQSKTFDETDQFIKEETENLGGLLTDRSVSGTAGYRYANYTVRIPSKNFDEFFFKVAGAWTVTSQQITSEDVTERYTDLELQLETNKAKYERLLTLLDKAETLTDIYSIQTELAQVEYEINSIQGTLNHMTSRIAYSTITIYVREVDSEPVMDDGSFWSALAASLSNGWSTFTTNLQDWVLDLAYDLPYLVCTILVLAVIIFVVLKIRKRLKGKGTGVRLFRRKTIPTPPSTSEQDKTDDTKP